MNCPVCQSSADRQHLILNRGDFILSSAFLPARPGSNGGLGRMELVECDACGFAFNRAFDEAKMRAVYTSENYAVKRVSSASMSRSLLDIRQCLERWVPTGRVLEIASGNGAMARSMAGKAEEVVTIDPSSDAHHESAGNLKHVRGYFSAKVLAEATNLGFDLVLARHLLEHLPDPHSFLQNVDRCLSPHGKIYLELPDMEEISAAGRFFDLFYDHFGYYNETTFKRLVESSGFRVIETHHFFAHQHMGYVLERKDAESPSARRPPIGLNYTSFNRHLEQLQNHLKEIPAPIHVWGAGAHGNTLVNFLSSDLRQKFVACFDRDPNKQGRYLQNSDAKIMYPSDEAVLGAFTIIIAASLYEEEIVADLYRLGFKGEIVKTAQFAASDYSLHG